jgi:hypothetical protein
LSPTQFCDEICQLSPDDRYQHLKELDGNALFCDVVRLKPELWREFMWFEKCAQLESALVHRIDDSALQKLAERGMEAVGTTRFSELLSSKLIGDEIWKFHSIPGDIGYALIRRGRIIDFAVLEVYCV